MQQRNLFFDEDPDIGPADVEYASRPQDLRPFNAAVPLRDGAQAYPAMLAAIAAARRYILFETYIFVDDTVGRLFAEALIQRARARVVVRMIYDAVGSFGLSDGFVARLRDAGVQTVEYHPVAPWRPRFSLIRRNHRKVLVVDDSVAFTGGLNVSDDYAAVEDGGKGWRDCHVELRGPVVVDFARLFRVTWLQCGGAVYPEPPRSPHVIEPERRDGDVLAGVLSNALVRYRLRFIRAYVRAIERAERSVSIANAYFIPTWLVRRALYRAVARGVSVSVIVPGVSDVKAVRYASMYLYKQLLRAGIRIFEWEGRMMHAKAAVVDGVWATVGSYNFDSQSLRNNLEVGVVAIDRPFAQSVAEQLERDKAQCHEVTLTEVAGWTWTTRILAWLAYRIRRFL